MPRLTVAVTNEVSTMIGCKTLSPADEADTPPPSPPPCYPRWMCPGQTANTIHEFFKEHDKVPWGTPDFPDLNTTGLSGRDCTEAMRPVHDHYHTCPKGSTNVRHSASGLVRAELCARWV